MGPLEIQFGYLISNKTSSNQRLGECVRSKMDSQSVAKEHDRRHTMLFNMPQMERNREERNLITPHFGGQIA